MPELIDLEIMSENINNVVGGKKLTVIEFPVPKVLQNCEIADIKDSLEGQVLEKATRLSKFVVFNFANDAKLILHLMLHGNLCWKKDTPKIQHVVCELDFDEESLLIKDWSAWAKIELDDPAKGFKSEIFHDVYGIDPLSAGFTIDKLNEILKMRSRANIKSILMDQKCFAGIGNAYADETLFAANIHPLSRAGKILDAGKSADLYNALKKVLPEALDKVRAMAGGRSVTEQSRDFMQVYRKSGKKCPNCNYMISQSKVNGRDTFVCEKCQVKYF